MSETFNTTNSLAHTKWNCKYHIVFAPKYRRKVFYDEYRTEVREILRQLCQLKGVEIIEREICPDHILCGYGRKEYKSDTRICSKSIKSG